jgi:DNA-binding winged helix-turn-helix (wHTH) protein/Tol biopolymer transport system component
MSLELSSNFLQFGIDMANGNGHGIYEFDEFKLDAVKLMLYRGEREITLPPKVVKTLAVLVENSGEILSKDELMTRVWEDSIVEESNLSQYLYLLRKTLGERPDGGNYIETLRRRGYRFNGDVHSTILSIEKNGHAKPRSVSAPDIAIERHGNVLRLVDRAPDKLEMVAVANAPAIEAPPRFPTSWTRVAFAVVMVAAMAVTATVTYMWLGRPQHTSVDSKKEVSISRLTNGGWPGNASIAPDGNYFSYTEADGDVSKLWLQTVGQSTRIEIVSSEDKILGSSTFTPDGRFIYYYATEKADLGSQAIYRVPTIGGPSAKILQGETSIVSFSPDGSEMTYTRTDRSAGRSSLVIADKDGRTERTLLTREVASDFSGSPAWSPDGKLIAFAENIPIEGGSPDLHRIRSINISNGDVQDISSENWDTVYRMEWKRDGTGILFIGTRENEAHSSKRDQVYFLSYPDGASRRITTSGVRHQPDSLGVTKDHAILAATGSRSSQIWSVDPSGVSTTAVQISTGLYDGRPGLAPLIGGRVGYITYTSEDFGVWIMNGDGSGAKLLSSDPSTVEELRADPLGRFFVFSSYAQRHDHLYRINTDGSGLKQLTSGDGNEIDSAVSPDGTWVVYGSTVFKNKVASTRLMRSPSDGGEPTVVGDNACSRPNFSPDGRFLSCVTEDDKEIWVLSPDDGRRVNTLKVPAYTSVNFGVRWTPNSDGIVYIRTDKSTTNLWVQPLDGTAAHRLTDFTSGVIYNFAFAPDGMRLYLARGYPEQQAILIKNF